MGSHPALEIHRTGTTPTVKKLCNRQLFVGAVPVFSTRCISDVAANGGCDRPDPETWSRRTAIG